LDKKSWVIIVIALAVVASFLFSSGFRNTISRRRLINQFKVDLNRVSQEIEGVRADIKQLKNNPQAYEVLIRKELGYLKPGEKEVRFVEKH
jgi:cell division protein FtsB